MKKKVSMCRIVEYQLSAGDVNLIDERLPISGTVHRNPVTEGQVYPALVVRVWGNGDSANLQVFLDGDCTYWATSRGQGDEPGKWSWPDKKDD